MATFVKLTNGDIVNAQYIKSIKRHEHADSSAFREALRKGRDSESGEYRIEKVASIELQLGRNPNPLLLKYESEQERDAEYERIEAILLTKQVPLFTNLLLNPALIQSMLVEWSGTSDDALKLRIKVAGSASFVIVVHQYEKEDWARAHDLIAQLGLSLPKTLSEHMQESRKKGFGTL